MACFPNFSAVRTATNTYDVYTNDRTQGLCFPTVYFLFQILLILLYHIDINSEVYQASFYAISDIFLSQKLTLAMWKYHW